MNLEALLTARLAPAFALVAGATVDPAVRRSRHADFQSGAALPLAGPLGRPPRVIAAEVLAAADLAGIATAEISGPGFLNLRLTGELLATGANRVVADPRLGVPLTPHPERVVADYSSPNIAKELTVGHLRSTVIGDAIARLLQWRGHDVVRANHLGDWGTAFGMLIEHLGHADAASITDLTVFYQQARARFDADEDFRTRSRLRVVALQSGDERTLEQWRHFTANSQRQLLATYDRLGVTLGPDDFLGESFYNDKLASVVAELSAKGLLSESEGALCAFPAGFTGRSGEPLPLIVRKSDGGYGYAATDLAALRHRTADLAATRLLYVVGAPQRDHFAMVFAVAAAAGWLPDGVRAEHVGFGSILGADGKMFRTRAGESVKLAAVLDEAETRAAELAPSAPVARAVGVGAVKYADLSSDRMSDYVFDWDRMLALTGNTGPYVQYAYARARSILRKAGSTPAGPIRITAPAERALVLELLGFAQVVADVDATLSPHRLAGYLYGVAQAFNVFFGSCPVLTFAESRESRLGLCELTGRTLRQGLELLGIDTPERL